VVLKEKQRVQNYHHLLFLKGGGEELSFQTGSGRKSGFSAKS